MQPSEVASLKLSREEPERAHDREEKLCGEIGENFPGSIQEYLEKGNGRSEEFGGERQQEDEEQGNKWELTCLLLCCPGMTPGLR